MKTAGRKQGGMGQVAAAWVIRRGLGALAWSLKVEVHGGEHVEAALAGGRPIVLATWHGNIISVFLMRLRIQIPLLITMISRSRDGDLATEVAKRFGVLPVRGSSSRGGAEAMIAYRNEARAQEALGRSVAGIHLIDGPRGPRHAAKPGVLLLARHTGAVIVPVLTGAHPCRYANSWDRHAIPLPFARMSLRFGEAIEPGEATTELLEARLRGMAEADPLIEPSLGLGERRAEGA